MSELPKGWEIVTFAKLCELNPRKPDAKQIFSDTKVTFIPMAAVDATLGMIANPTIRVYSSVAKGFTSFQENDVLMAKITPCMENGKAAIARGLNNGVGFGSTEFHVFRPSAAILPEYIFYFIRQKSFRKLAEASMTGSVGQKRVPSAFLIDREIPLPPLNEQHRIVAKLEQLLSKLEACQRRLEKIPRILKRFRQAVLAAACSGRLTADLRRQLDLPQYNQDNGIPSTWKYVDFSEIVKVKAGEAFKKSEYSESGARLLQIANVSFNQIIWEQENYLPVEYLDRYPDISLKEGDILMALNRPILNWQLKVARIKKEDLPAILYQRVGRFTLQDRESVDPDYLYWFFQSFEFVLLVNDRLRGTDQPYINPSEMFDIKVPIPSINEQQEIVRRIESLFKHADQLEARYINAKTHVDKLQQSILAKAFRGELVPQDPNDEPARVLLERVRAEREVGAANGKGGIRKAGRTTKRKRAVRKGGAKSGKLFE